MVVVNTIKLLIAYLDNSNLNLFCMEIFWLKKKTILIKYQTEWVLPFQEGNIYKKIRIHLSVKKSKNKSARRPHVFHWSKKKLSVRPYVFCR